MAQHIEIDGAPATAEALGALLLPGYGHFTALQVRGHAVRGLDLHLDRLRTAHRELFGADLDGERVRAHVRGALRRAATGDASVRVQVVAADPAPGAVRAERPAGGVPGGAEPTRVIVSVRPPAESDGSPVRLRAVAYERLLPHLEHLDTMCLVHHARRARQAGYDDALLVDRHGRVTESATANVLLYDGEEFVWPDSPALPGTMRALLLRGMARLEVPVSDRTVRLAEVARFRSAFLAGSLGPAQPVAAVDDVRFTIEESARALLRTCYETNAWETV